MAAAPFVIEPAVAWGLGVLGVGAGTAAALKDAELSFPNTVGSTCLNCEANMDSEAKPRDDSDAWYPGKYKDKEWYPENNADDTKGKTKLRIRKGGGGFEQANDNFDDLDLSDVAPIETKAGSGRKGNLSDGRKVTVRPGSSDGRSTLEIRKPNGRGIEIRYDN